MHRTTVYFNRTQPPATLCALQVVVRIAKADGRIDLGPPGSFG